MIGKKFKSGEQKHIGGRSKGPGDRGPEIRWLRFCEGGSRRRDSARGGLASRCRGAIHRLVKDGVCQKVRREGHPGVVGGGGGGVGQKRCEKKRSLTNIFGGKKKKRIDSGGIKVTRLEHEALTAGRKAELKILLQKKSRRLPQTGQGEGFELRTTWNASGIQRKFKAT